MVAKEEALLQLSTGIVVDNVRAFRRFRPAVFLALVIGVTPLQARDLLDAAGATRVTNSVLTVVAGGGQGSVLDSPITDAVTDITESEVAVRLSSVIDAVGPDLSRCRAGDTSLSRAYESLLKSAVWSKDLLTPPDRKRLSTLKELLFQADGKPVSGYSQFLTLRKAVEDATADLNNTPPDKQTAVQKERLKKAQEDLNLLGEAKVWGPRDSSYKQLEPRQVNRNLQKYLSTWPDGGAPIAQGATEFRPSISASLEESNWISSSITVDLGQAAPSWIGQSTTIKFKWIRLAVQRKWFDESLFLDDSWKIADTVADGLGGGSIGRYVTGVVFAKDISISILSPNNAKRAIKKELETSDRVAIGNIPIADRTPGSGPFVAIVSPKAKQILVPFSVVLGCISSNLPRSPNPNQAYQW